MGFVHNKKNKYWLKCFTLGIFKAVYRVQNCMFHKHALAFLIENCVLNIREHRV